jgi:hypothetical protein
MLAAPAPPPHCRCRFRPAQAHGCRLRSTNLTVTSRSCSGYTTRVRPITTLAYEGETHSAHATNARRQPFDSFADFHHLLALQKPDSRHVCVWGPVAPNIANRNFLIEYSITRFLGLREVGMYFLNIERNRTVEHRIIVGGCSPPS